MRLPTICGIIDRRVLVNFQVDPKTLARVCPPPFRPQIIDGVGIAGICLIRLKQIRPKFLPSVLGLSSENAAHRIAVQWDVDGQVNTGVYIPRRDTSSRLNALAGGRVFPGVHNRATFDVRESGNNFKIDMNSLDGSAHVSVHGKTSSDLPKASVFSSLAQCSQFFESGSLGYSPSAETGKYDGLELQSFNWRAEPLAVNHVQSSFFDDQEMFPKGTVKFDNALLMRNIDHQWHSRNSLCSCET